MLATLRPNLSLWASAACGILFLLICLRSRRHFVAMPELRGAPRSHREDAALPDCMVVIPARNEEANIARAVLSFPPDTVIVVDDHSDDGTSAVATKAGAGVLAAPDLPRGAAGKPHACIAGARILTSRWILFADADTSYEKGFLEAVVAHAESTGVSFLSIYLSPVGQTAAAKTVIPYAAALFFSGVNPRRHPAAAFNGQCLLVLREAYEFIGGHSAVLTCRIEDVILADLADRHRMKLGSARATRLGHAHMSGGLFSIRTSVVRNAARFTLVSPWIGMQILFSALALALWLPLLFWLVFDQRWLAAGLFFLTPAVLLVSWYRNAVRALFAPLALYIMLPILWSGFMAALSGRPVKWKGRWV